MKAANRSYKVPLHIFPLFMRNINKSDFLKNNLHNLVPEKHFDVSIYITLPFVLGKKIYVIQKTCINRLITFIFIIIIRNAKDNLKLNFFKIYFTLQNFNNASLSTVFF